MTSRRRCGQATPRRCRTFSCGRRRGQTSRWRPSGAGCSTRAGTASDDDANLIATHGAVSDPPLSSLGRTRRRGRKRGILENDILLGTFAARYLPELSAEELALYDDMMCENDWDIYYWVFARPTGSIPFRGAPPLILHLRSPWP